MLIILDRDGVINYESTEYIKTPDEWIPIEGSLEAVAQLIQAGHTVLVATNQSGVGRGYYTLETMHKIHEKMQEALAEHGGQIHRVYYCPHTPSENCECRKPKPGLLLQIAKDFPDEFKEAIFVGDSARDVHAAIAAGIQPLLVRTGNGETVDGVLAFDDLAAVVRHILS